MNKIEKLNSTLKCPICFDILCVPIILPCGKTVCTSHTTLVSKSIQCPLCSETHGLPLMGFTKNIIVQEMLELELNILNIHFKTFDDCKVSLSALRKSLNDFEIIVRDPTHFIYSHFEDFKIQVDLHREASLLEAHNKSKIYIDAIEYAHDDCINNTKITKSKEDSDDTTTVGLLADIELYREEFSKIYNNFDTFDINGDRLGDILQIATSLQARICRDVDEHKRKLLGTYFEVLEDLKNKVWLRSRPKPLILCVSVCVEGSTCYNINYIVHLFIKQNSFFFFRIAMALKNQKF